MRTTLRAIPTQSLTIKVNSYLIQNDAGFFLVDTGLANRRPHLEQTLESAGCKPGDLRLVLLTHGDLDHSGNGAYLREKFGTKIAMHRADLVNVQSGDMFANKKVNQLARSIAGFFFFLTRMNQFDRFTPDIFLDDGQSLAEFGLDAAVIHLPGHSKGSIGILTAAGDLFCGDLLENTKRAVVNSLGDDPQQMRASVEKLKAYSIKMIYPGHGRPFTMAELLA